MYVNYIRKSEIFVYFQVKHSFAVEERYFEHLGHARVSPARYMGLHASYFQNIHSIISHTISE
jgi:hypothetical protein